MDQADVMRRSGMTRDWVSRRIGVDKETGLPRGGGIQADEIEVFARALQVSPCVLVDDQELERLLDGPRTPSARSTEHGFEADRTDRIAASWAERVLALPERDVQLLVDFLAYRQQQGLS